MPDARLLTMTDLLIAMERADDHHIALRRAALPDGIEAAADGRVLYVDPGCEIGRYARLLVDGVGYLVERDQPARAHLTVVPEPEPGPDGDWQLPRVAG